MNITEKLWWNKTWNSVLVRLGIKKIPGVANSLGDKLYAAELLGATTADMTLYVDAAAGSDANTGLVGFPLKTIQAAIDRVPYEVRNNVTVNVAAGTYAECVRINKFINRNKLFALQGDLAVYTPAAGPASGTFTSNDGIHGLTLLGATWNVDALAGKFVKITSGGMSGKYFPISNNTADTLTVGANASVIGNSSFEFAYPSATITVDSSATTSIAITNNLQVGSVAGTSGFLIKNLVVGSGTGTSVIADFIKAVTLTNCVFLSGLSARYSAFWFNMCYATASVPLTFYGYTQLLSSIDGVLNCTGAASYGISNYGAQCYLGAGFNYSGLIIQNAAGANTGAGIMLTRSAIAYHNGMVTIRGCRVGVRATNGMNTLRTAGGTLSISGNAYGILVDAVAGFGQLTLDASAGIMNVTGCTQDAVNLQTNGNYIKITTTSAITGNTGFGIKVATGNATSHNNIQIGSSVTMNTNTAGDLTLDGTTPITIAALRALVGPPAKTLLDNYRFNRIAAD